MKSLECVSNYCGLTMLQNKLMISRCRKEKQMYEANAAPSIIKLDEHVTSGSPSTLLYLSPPRSV